MTLTGVAIKCINGDTPAELGQSVKFLRMPADRERSSGGIYIEASQSKKIAERAIKQLMQAARSQRVRFERGEEYWFFVANATCKTSGMPHEYLEVETPCERLAGKPFNHNCLCTWDRSVSCTNSNNSASPLRSSTPGVATAGVDWVRK